MCIYSFVLSTCVTFITDNDEQVIVVRCSNIKRQATRKILHWKKSILQQLSVLQHFAELLIVSTSTMECSNLNHEGLKTCCKLSYCLANYFSLRLSILHQTNQEWKGS